MVKKTLHNNWYFLALIWSIINLLQSYFTTLIDDEAYYWMFSEQLDWSFFDHPPMVALFIKAGYSIFPNELGLRLVTVLVQILFLRIVWSFITHPKKENYVWLYFLIAGSIPMLQIYGFITTPDTALLFFSSFTLWAYQKYLEKENPLNILLFAISCAALMYSKYHGALLIFAILSANWKLLTKPSFYLVGLIALGLFFPHIQWQWENDFISFQYHLFERVENSYPLLILENLLNQFLLYHPVIWILFIPVFIYQWRQPNVSIFNKTLLHIFVWFGILLLIFSFRLKRVEPHWTILFCIPLIIFLFNYLVQQPSKLHFFKKIGLISVFVLGIARILLVTVNVPLLGITYQPKEKIATIDNLAKGLPVIYLNSYQNAAIHAFYTKNKQKTYGLNSYMAIRRNQFDIWDNTSELNGQDVFFVSQYPTSQKNDTIQFSNQKRLFYHIYPNYINIKKLGLDVKIPQDTTFHAGDTIQLNAILSNPYDYKIITNSIWMIFRLGKINTRCNYIKKPSILAPNSDNEMILQIALPDTTGNFDARFLMQLYDDYPKNYYGNKYSIILK